VGYVVESVDSFLERMLNFAAKERAIPPSQSERFTGLETPQHLIACKIYTLTKSFFSLSWKRRISVL
jgi:hypothetical protein